jgi:hypothetical chaperone protein
MSSLAIDFGTSNTAAAVLDGGTPRLLRLEGRAETLPTAVFLDFDRRRTLVGQAAVDALIAGEEGRFMRALKSVLGTALMHETRQFLNERMTLVTLVGRFLAAVKAEAEAQCGTPFSHVLSGRPVHFHDDDERDARALEDLRACYAAAGFGSVDFLPEPEAAALSSGAGDGLGLVIDIGGGTSDFTVFHREGRETGILTSHGIRMGGTDFDRVLSLAHVMPLLGKGTDLKAEFGPGRHEAPLSIFYDLATWSMIPFLYNATTRRDAREMAKRAVQPERFARLVEVLDLEIGHDIAFAVERGKIAASSGQTGRIDLSMVEPGLAADLTPGDLTRDLRDQAATIRAAAETTLAAAGCRAAEVDHLVFVGGSSLMSLIVDTLGDLCPQATPHHGRAFTAIVDGLALATARPR